MVVVVVFFFFQAEDGIRDDLVTGVQTCALPILCNFAVIPGRHVAPDPKSRYKFGACFWIPGSLVVLAPRNDGESEASHARSEERRVGKEGRSRWSPYH